MKLPRFRIAWLMVAVAVAAINFGAIRGILEIDIPDKGMLWVVGALPMVNILAAGLLIALRRPRSRPFLLGFETFGALALALYVVVVIFFDRDVVASYLEPVADPIGNAIGTVPTLVLIPARVSAGLILLVGPQLAFALIGGFLSRRFARPARIFSPPDRMPA
jgi:hypothetical protein